MKRGHAPPFGSSHKLAHSRKRLALKGKGHGEGRPLLDVTISGLLV